MTLEIYDTPSLPLTGTRQAIGCDLDVLEPEVPAPSPTPVESCSTSWTLACLFAHDGKDFDLYRLLERNNISCWEIAYSGVLSHRQGWILVVPTSFIRVLSEKLSGLVVEEGYRFMATSDEACRDGQHKARTDFITNAVRAAQCHLGPEPMACFREFSRANSLAIFVERAILNRDIRESESGIRGGFARNILLVCLGITANQSSHHTDQLNRLLQRDVDDWLRPFQDELGNPYYDPTDSSLSRGQFELQTVSLLRMLLEFSGGRKPSRRPNTHLDLVNYSTADNAGLCGMVFGVYKSTSFGGFNPEAMHMTLLRSRLFSASTDMSSIPDLLSWSRSLMASVPVGLPDDYLNLPRQLLDGLDTQALNQFKVHMGYTYRLCPELNLPKNNVLLLLTWSSKYSGQPLRVLTDWVQSTDGKSLSESLVVNIREESANLAMNLLALLLYERLLPYGSEPPEPIGSSYLADFHAIIHSQKLVNKRHVLEEMVISLRQALALDNKNEDFIYFISDVLDRNEARPTYLDGACQYWRRRVNCLLLHEEAYNQHIEGLLIAISKFREESGVDEETVIVSRAYELSLVA